MRILAASKIYTCNGRLRSIVTANKPYIIDVMLLDRRDESLNLAVLEKQYMVREIAYETIYLDEKKEMSCDGVDLLFKNFELSIVYDEHKKAMMSENENITCTVLWVRCVQKCVFLVINILLKLHLLIFNVMYDY